MGRTGERGGAVAQERVRGVCGNAHYCFVAITAHIHTHIHPWRGPPFRFGWCVCAYM